MSRLDIHLFPCLSDNYGVLIHDEGSDRTASIDAPDAGQVEAALAAKGWRLDDILTTHKHGDHTDGNLALKAKHGCTITGPRGEADKVPGIDKAVGQGDAFRFGSVPVQVLETPGHTLGHIAYWMPDHGVAFVGDTLFAMGCGRVFEGTMRMMWDSLSKLAALPPSTILYCGHEYTLANAKFAVGIEPGNARLQARLREVEAMRAQGAPTVPTTVALELETNPFLRVKSPEIRKTLGLEGAEDWQVFAEVRERKNRG
jgi:hydroxyacylglutathione hydrolase